MASLVEIAEWVDRTADKEDFLDRLEWTRMRLRIARKEAPLAEKNPLILGRLRRLCHRWGGQLRWLPLVPYTKLWQKHEDHLSEAGFSANELAVWWERKQIIYTGPLLWPDLIHEMGHVFASLKHPRAEDAVEFDFFGWEFATAVHVGADLNVWKHANREYIVLDRATALAGKPQLGYLTTQQQDEILRERLLRARALGLIDAARRPLAIR